MIKITIRESVNEINAADRKMQRAAGASQLNTPVLTAFFKDKGWLPLHILNNEFNPFLGKGAQGKVYSVTKNGKERALKLANMDPMSDSIKTKSEFEIRKHIENIKKTMPKHLQKIFPKIDEMGTWTYKSQGDAPRNDGYLQSGDYYYYITEKLYPLEKLESKYLRSASSAATNSPEEPNLLALRIYSADDFKNIYAMAKVAIESLFVSYEKQEIAVYDIIKEDLLSLIQKLWFKYVTKSYVAKKSEIFGPEADVFPTGGVGILTSELSTKFLNDPDTLRLIDNHVVELIRARYAPELIQKAIKLDNMPQDFSPPTAGLKNIVKRIKYYQVGAVTSFFETIIEFAFKPRVEYSKEKEYTIPEPPFAEGPILAFERALTELSKPPYNLDISDIRDANVMRRKDGSIVVADIGTWMKREQS